MPYVNGMSISLDMIIDINEFWEILSNEYVEIATATKNAYEKTKELDIAKLIATNAVLRNLDFEESTGLL